MRILPHLHAPFCMILHGRVRRSLILGRDWEPNGNIAEERYHAMHGATSMAA